MAQSKTQSLRQTYSNRKLAYDTKCRERMSIYNLALEDAKRKIQMFVDCVYTTELNALEQSEGEALDALNAELEQVALSGEGAPFPLGTNLKKEVQKRWEPVSTIYGFVEVITRTSVHSEHQGNRGKNRAIRRPPY